MTHQDIIDRLEALYREFSKAFAVEQARIKKERESLQELCGGIGHFFAKERGLVPSVFPRGRCCLFCDMPEPKGPDRG